MNTSRPSLYKTIKSAQVGNLNEYSGSQESSTIKRAHVTRRKENGSDNEEIVNGPE